MRTARNAARLRELSRPAAYALVQALHPQPGERLLELGSGSSDAGLLAAELIAPHGTLTASDDADAPLELARARAADLRVDNAEFKLLDPRWLDLPLASHDALVAHGAIARSDDPQAALREARRVLRPGGRVAIARDLLPATLAHALALTPGDPTAQQLALLADAGFTEIETTTLTDNRIYTDADELLDVTLESDAAAAEAFGGLADVAVAAVEAAARAAADPDGSVTVAVTTLIATASA